MPPEPLPGLGLAPPSHPQSWGRGSRGPPLPEVPGERDGTLAGKKLIQPFP